MKQEKIDALQTLLDAGTQGKWERTDDFLFLEGDEDFLIEVYSNKGVTDASLISELHNLAPALLEAARENLRLRKALEKIAGMNETGGVLNVSMTMLATETIAKAALGKETA